MLRLADEMSGAATSSLTEELIDGLRRHFTEDELAELVLIGGHANLNNRVGNAAKQVLGADT